MSELADFFPAIMGALLGVIALVSMHLAVRRLKAERRARESENAR